MDGLASLPAILVGLTFVIAAANKLRDPHGFALGVLDYEILPPRIALTFARALPFAEVLVGITLLAGVWPLGSGLASASPFQFSLRSNSQHGAGTVHRLSLLWFSKRRGNQLAHRGQALVPPRLRRRRRFTRECHAPHASGSGAGVSACGRRSPPAVPRRSC